MRTKTLFETINLLTFSLLITSVFIGGNSIGQEQSITDQENKDKVQYLISSSIDSLTLPASMSVSNEKSAEIDFDSLQATLELSVSCNIDFFGLYCDEESVEFTPQAKIEEDGSRIYYLNAVSTSEDNYGTVEQKDVEQCTLDTAIDISEMLGIQSNEASFQQAEVWRDIASDQKEETAPKIQTDRMNYVTYVNRQVNGIPVLNNRLAFVYENNGSLRSINGKWHKINYEKSQYSTEMSLDEIVDMAAITVLSKNVNPDKLSAINLKAGYIVEKNAEGEFVLNLLLEMSMDKIKGETHEDNLPYDSLIIDI